MVGSIEDFHFYNCPECQFKSKGNHDFKEHALENHPCSIDLFYPSHETCSPLSIKEEKQESVAVEVDNKFKPPDDSESKFEPEEIDENQDNQGFLGHQDPIIEYSDSDEDYVPEKKVNKKKELKHSDGEDDTWDENEPKIPKRIHFKCPKCFLICENRTDYGAHIKTGVVHQDWNCPMCSNEFSDAPALKKHQNDKCHDKTKAKCKRCGEWKRVVYMEKHEKLCSGQLVYNHAEKSMREDYKCPMCYEEFPNRTIFRDGIEIANQYVSFYKKCSDHVLISWHIL